MAGLAISREIVDSHWLFFIRENIRIEFHQEHKITLQRGLKGSLLCVQFAGDKTSNTSVVLGNLSDRHTCRVWQEGKESAVNLVTSTPVKMSLGCIHFCS